MTKTTALILTLCALLLAAAPADAKKKRWNVRVGLGDQNVPMFADPNFQRLNVRQVRYFIHWNAMLDREQRLKAREWVVAARNAGTRPFLHVSTDDLRHKRGKLPRPKLYRKRIARMVRYFHRLGVRDFGSWNEVNHKSQPTWRSPRRAAQYWKIMRRVVKRRCGLKRCRVVGLDVLDQRGVKRYIRRFVRHAGRRYTRRHLRVVGIHNYSDVNRKRTRGLRGIIRTVRRYRRSANFWLTETGGVVKFGRSFPCSERRAAKRLRFLFRTAKRYRRHLQRIYLYSWYGGACDQRWDAGLVGRHGELRPGYHVVRRNLRRFKR